MCHTLTHSKPHMCHTRTQIHVLHSVQRAHHHARANVNPRANTGIAPCRVSVHVAPGHALARLLLHDFCWRSSSQHITLSDNQHVTWSHVIQHGSMVSHVHVRAIRATPHVTFNAGCVQQALIRACDIKCRRDCVISSADWTM